MDRLVRLTKITPANQINSWSRATKSSSSPAAGTCNSPRRRACCPPGSPGSCVCTCWAWRGTLEEDKSVKAPANDALDRCAWGEFFFSQLSALELRSLRQGSRRRQPKLTVEEAIVFETAPAEERVERVQALLALHRASVGTVDVGRAFGGQRTRKLLLG